MLGPKDLCGTFSERAEWTSGIIGDGYSTRLGILEETITDINLVEIGRRHPDHVITRKFSRKDEGASSGADWLWCIGEPGSWCCLLIQAKIINPRTGNCHYLNYKGGDQRAKLLKYALRNRLLPRYCIYSFIPPRFTPALKAGSRFESCDPVQWGCSLLTPQRVSRLVARKQTRRPEVLAEALPWNHLFCIGRASHDVDRLGPFVASAVADGEGWIDEYARGTELDQETADPDLRRRRTSIDPSELLRDELPRTVQRLLRGTLSSAESPVGGVSVVSSLPVRAVLGETAALQEHDRANYLDDWRPGERQSSRVGRREG